MEQLAADPVKPSLSRHHHAPSDGTIAAIALPSGNLATDLRDATRALREQAERSGISAQMLRGSVSIEAYALLLRNLLPVYRALEDGLERHRDAAGIRLVARPALYRGAAIAHDLAALGFVPDRMPLLPGAVRYAHRIEEIAAAEPCRLIGHAWTRYIGDLSDGQILRKLLGRLLRVPPAALTRYCFADIADLHVYRAEYGLALSHAAYETDSEAIIDEAMQSFRLMIALSCAVEAAALEPARALRTDILPSQI
ncbi:MAG: biliverdin-producing heme oxygenase [Xanthobacteraceae bacterium]